MRVESLNANKKGLDLALTELLGGAGHLLACLYANPTGPAEKVKTSTAFISKLVFALHVTVRCCVQRN